MKTTIEDDATFSHKRAIVIKPLGRLTFRMCFHESMYEPGKFWLGDSGSENQRLWAPASIIAAWNAGEPWQIIFDYLFEKYPEETKRLHEAILDYEQA
jgi:hypothetical protein